MRGEHLITVILTSLGAYLGYLIAAWSDALLTSTSSALNTVFLTGAGSGIGFLTGYSLRHHTQRVLRSISRTLSRTPSELIIASVLGSTIGLTFAVMLNLFLERIPGYHWSIGTLVGLISMAGFATLTISHRHGLSIGVRGVTKTTPDTILDTSALIDNRTIALLRSGISEQPPAISTRVLNELHHLISQPQTHRKQRGEQGLKHLETLEQDFGALTPLHDDLPPSEETDIVLAELASRRGLTLITVDYHLTRTARRRGARVLNLNELAHALRPQQVVGDEIEVYLEDHGTERGQAVGHLDDGTFVIVRNAEKHVGTHVSARIGNILERQTGRVLFAELLRATRAADSRPQPQP